MRVKISGGPTPQDFPRGPKKDPLFRGPIKRAKNIEKKGIFKEICKLCKKSGKNRVFKNKMKELWFFGVF